VALRKRVRSVSHIAYGHGEEKQRLSWKTRKHCGDEISEEL
jgi:hypothetical protein